MIAGRPSATALLVALSVWRHGAAHGLPDASIRIAGEALTGARGIWPWLRRCAATRVGGWLLDRLESLLLPGLGAHHCRRKQWLWQALSARSAAQRWIWLGVGFDGLGRALGGQRCAPDLIELDHPDSLALRARLPFVQLPPGIQMQPLSLPADTAALQRLCSERPSVVVAEGLLMYLSPRPLLRLLRALARQSNPPELWLSALSPEHPQGRGFGGGRGVTCAWLHAQGEPFRWRIEPERLQALLRRHGYVTEQLWDGAGYGEFVLGARPLQRVDATAPEADPTLCATAAP